MPSSHTTSVDRIYGEAGATLEFLRSAGEISLAVAAEDVMRKALLLSAASYFEHTLTTRVLDFAIWASSANSLIPSLVKEKAVVRQYHTWFDWDKSNANKFFSMFGERFKQYMIEWIEVDEVLAESVQSFLLIGRERNRLVHQDFASFAMSLNTEEIYERFKSAKYFSDSIGDHLRAC